MQQILNSQDRNQAFLKFLLFFLVTLVLAILAVYFNYRLPVRENSMLQDEVNLQRQMDEGQSKFSAKMQEAIVLLDSLDKPGINYDQVSSQLDGKLTDLSVLQLKDNTAYSRIDAAVVNQLFALEEKKKDLRKAQEKVAEAVQDESDLASLRTQLAQANADLDAYRNHK